MVVGSIIFKEIIKRGYAESDSGRVWDIANMSFLHLTSEMAKGYLNLKEHPRYKATVVDIEIDLLKKHSANFLKCVENCQFNLIDFGCSDGLKAKVVIESLSKEMKFRYCPVSVNKYSVDLAFENVKKGDYENVKDYAPRVSDSLRTIGEIGSALRNSRYQKNVTLLLGSLLGSFQINHYLFGLSRSMFPGDVLIIGNGVRKGERFANLETYKHPIFHNWFVHLLKELGFTEEEIEYDARFNNDRVEGFYKIKVDKEIESEGNKIQFKKGDEVIVAVVYKYYEKELEKFCKMYFPEVRLVSDVEKESALVFCRR